MSLPPYAELLSISRIEGDEGAVFLMPFGDGVLGRPGYVHGGAIAGLLEIAAIGTLMEALAGVEGAGAVRIKPINMTTSYMRGGTARETYAAAKITRLGTRVANVEAHAWQAARDTPIAAAQLNLMLKRN